MRLKFSTFGRTVAFLWGMSSDRRLKKIFMRTVCSIGEASRKSSSCKEQTTSGLSMDRSSDVKFGKAKWFKKGHQSESWWKRNTFRFVGPQKRGVGSVMLLFVPSGLYPVVKISRVCRRGSGPELTSEKL